MELALTAIHTSRHKTLMLHGPSRQKCRKNFSTARHKGPHTISQQLVANVVEMQPIRHKQFRPGLAMVIQGNIVSLNVLQIRFALYEIGDHDVHRLFRFMLFPPEQLENLYIGPLEFTPQGVPISLVDVHNPDLARYPRFEQAAAAAQVAELEAGDALFIPYLWWHSVRSLEPFNILINYWWNAVLRPPVAPFHSLLHGVIAIANLPAPQRRVWKRFFDHYVFQVHGDPAEHIAQERRGLLGSLSSEQAAQFTAVLAHLLGGTR